MWPFGRRNDTRCEDACFVVEEPLLGGQPTAESGQRSVGSDNPMTGEDDADGIRAVGSAEGARGLGDAERGRLLTIAGRGAERDTSQRPPGCELEARTLQVEREIERRARSGEVLVELGYRSHEDRMIRSAARYWMDTGTSGRQPGPEDRPETLVRRDEREHTDRCGVGCAVQSGVGLHHEASLTFTPAFPRWGWLIYASLSTLGLAYSRQPFHAGAGLFGVSLSVAHNWWGA